MMPNPSLPAGLQRLRDARAYLDDRLAFFARLADPSGAVVRCRLVSDGYLLNDPEDIRHVFVGNWPNYVKSRRLSGPRASYPPPHTLLTSAGMEHRRRRRLMHTVFRRPLVEKLVARASVNAERLAESWPDGAEVDVTAAMTALVQRSLLETVIASATEERLRRLAAASRARAHAFDRHFVSLFPLPDLLPSRANREFLRATLALRSAVEAEIAARRGTRERFDDLLSMLMDASYDDGSAMSGREVRDEVLSILVTGYDTVTAALQWALYLLAHNPASDADLAQEALFASGDGSSASLPRTHAAIQETLRIFPPTWMVARITRGADRLPSGARIPAGAKVYICSYAVHRNPRFWPQPERFLPERFTDGARRDRPRYAYFPFGGGPHACIGERLAMPQIATVLANVVSRRRLFLTPPREVVPDGWIALRPKNALTMRVAVRA